jgi:CMP-N-acetylneuraminic acid synthetase
VSGRKQKVVAIILARGGSKGLPRKNILPLMGKPLIQYTIEPIKKARLVDRIIVSTDDKEIAEIAKNIGAEVPYLRPKELARDDSTAEETLKHVIFWLRDNEKYNVDIVVYSQITDLFKKSEWIDKAVRMLLEDEMLDSVFMAHPEHKHYWKGDGNTYKRLTKENYGPRQSKEHIFREDTGLGCAIRSRVITQLGRRLGDRVKIIENEDFTVDVHSEFDLWLAEKLLKERPEFRKYLIK